MNALLKDFQIKFKGRKKVIKFKNMTEVFLIQCETDLSILSRDVDAGVYLENVEGYLKEFDRIIKKLQEAREMVNAERNECLIAQ